MTNSILNELHHRFEDLPAALARIAQYVLTNPEKVTSQSLAELAESSGSGQASVVRLVQSFGYKNFSAFKTALSIELSRRPSESVGEETELERLGRALAERTTTDAKETARLIAESRMEEAAACICDRGQAWVFGSGISAICAELLEYRLVREGIAATALRDRIAMRELASRLRGPAVAIAISDSGSTPPSIEFLRDAAAAGAVTIAISTRTTSELADHADILLQTGTTGGADRAGNILGVVARVSHIIEALCQTIERVKDTGSR